MVAPHAEITKEKMLDVTKLEVTKLGGIIAFSTWPCDLVDGNLFDVMAKYIISCSPNSSFISPSVTYVPNNTEENNSDIKGKKSRSTFNRT
jgi:hypothetical protein